MTNQWIWSARLRHRACGYNMSMSSADRAYHGRRRPPMSPAPDVVDVDHPFDADSLYELRATLAAHASHLGAPSEQIENLLIVVTELATNAILHGGGNGRIKLWHNDNVLYCQVSDRGPGIADQPLAARHPTPRTPMAGVASGSAATSALNSSSRPARTATAPPSRPSSLTLYRDLDRVLRSVRSRSRSARKSSQVRSPTALSGARLAPARSARAACPGSLTGRIGRCR